MLTNILSHFQIRRHISIHFIIITVSTISLIFITTLIIDYEEVLSLNNPLFHQQQEQDCTGIGSISGTINHEDVGAKYCVFNITRNPSRSDPKRRYKFLDSFWPGNKFLELSEKYTVSIATQSSLERLHSIVKVSQHWTGPISLAVFVAGEEFLLTELYITYLRQCFPHIKDQISFHLAYSLDYPPSDGPKLEFHFKQDCSNSEAVLLDLLKYRSQRTTSWRENAHYPQNHLRNQARANCQTEYIYLIDVDIIPSIDMADKLDQFLRKSQCDKLCAYVIPVYEIDDKAAFPRNKSEMLKLATNGMARPFYQEINRNSQSSTNYTM